MAVTFLNKTTGSQAAAGSHATASFTPTNGRLIFATCYYSGYSGTPTLTCAGLGLTWVPVTNIRSTVASVGRIYVFAALVSGSPTGAVTFTLSSSTAAALWSVDEAINSVTGGGALVQQPTNSADSGATTGSVTMAAFSSNQNMALCFVGHSNQNALTAEAGWTPLIDFANGANNRRLSAFYRATSAGDTTPSGTWTTAAGFVAIAIEINGDVPVDVSESMTIAEAVAGLVAASTAPSETMTIVEVVTAVVAATVGVNESLTIVEDLVAAKTYVEGVSETMTIAEAVVASIGSTSDVGDTQIISEEIYVEGGVEFMYPYNTQAAGGGSNAGYIASASSSSYESFAAQQEPTPLQGLEDAWEGVSDPVEDAWEHPETLGDAPPLEELATEPVPLSGEERVAARFLRKKKGGLAALGELIPNPASGAMGSGASTVAGYAAAKAGKLLVDKIDSEKPWMKKHGTVAAAAAATGAALIVATKAKSLRGYRGEIALGGLLAVLELASEAYGAKPEEEPVVPLLPPKKETP